MTKNKIINCYNSGSQKSVSVDMALFQLFQIHCKTDQRANEKVREFVRDHWGEDSLSKKVQHFMLSQVARPSLASKVFHGDQFNQGDLF